VSPADVRVLFNVPNAPWVQAQLGGAEITPFEFDRGAAQFDLSLTVSTEHFHRVHFEYATAVFTAGIDAAAGHALPAPAAAGIGAPEAPLSSLATLTPAELRALQQRGRRNERVLPAVQRIDEGIAAQAARTPQAVALSQGTQATDLHRARTGAPTDWPTACNASG